MKKIAFAILISTIFTGCASVKMESKEASDKAKQFAQPTAGNAGLYAYRDGSFGAAVKRDIRVDGKCIGASAANVFFFTEVAGAKEHVISTESEFSANDLSLMVEAGKNYFIRQYIKMGVFVGGAGLELIPEEQGKVAVAKLELATLGTCSN